jgi:hypothetical protein
MRDPNGVLTRIADEYLPRERKEEMRARVGDFVLHCGDRTDVTDRAVDNGCPPSVLGPFGEPRGPLGEAYLTDHGFALEVAAIEHELFHNFWRWLKIIKPSDTMVSATEFQLKGPSG